MEALVLLLTDAATIIDLEKTNLHKIFNPDRIGNDLYIRTNFISNALHGIQVLKIKIKVAFFHLFYSNS